MMGEHLKKPDDIDGFPYFPAGTHSLLQKCLTREIWEKCKNKTDEAGYSFRQAIFSGCKYTKSSVGVYAGCHDSYYTWAPLFDKII
jgi:hypothetical protein